MSTRPNDAPVELVHRFYTCLDERRYDDMADLMSQDGVWLRQGKVLRGPAQMLAALRERPDGIRVRHVITNGFADIDGDDATVSVYQTVYRGAQADPAEAATILGPSALSIVTARLRRTDGRGWRIVHLASRREFVIGAA